MQAIGSRPPSDRLARIWSAMSSTFWILALAVIGLFAFFLALGAFAVDDVVGVTIAVGALAVLWIAHAIWTSRHSSGRDPASMYARERRGF